MGLIELKDLLVPISEASPCGEDIMYDPDFLLLKEKRIVHDERSLDLWKEKKLSQNSDNENSANIQKICSNLLINKSKNLQVIAYLIEDLTKNHSFEGLIDGFALLNELCENFWDNLYPISIDENFLEERIKIFKWIDEKSAWALRFSALPILNLKDNISFDDIEKSNKSGVYSKKNILKEDSDLIKKYNIFISKINEKINNNIIENIDNSLMIINKFHTFLENKISFKEKLFFNLTNLLDRIKDFFIIINDDFKNKKNTINKIEEIQNEKLFTSQRIEDNFNLDTEKYSNSLTEDRSVIYEKIKFLADNLNKIDPHSPVPHFIFKLISWKDKTFLEIVNELGLNSPLFDFLNTRSFHEENEEANSRKRGMRENFMKMIK